VAPCSPTSVVDWIDAGTDRMRMVRRAATMDGAANRPGLGGVPCDPSDHEVPLLAGFRLAYDAIALRAAEFSVLVADCADLEVRVVCRPTWTYRTLLDETTHPDVLRDALDRDRALAVLCVGRTEDPLLAQLLAFEFADLWAGDVPLFVTAAGSRRLRTPAGTALPVPLPESGVDASLGLVTELGEVDRRDQEWIISASLATRRGAAAHPTLPPVALRAAGSAAHPDQLLAAACSVADRIIARGLPGAGRVNWLGLEAVDGRQWLILPLGAGLGHGHLGVAVFLAQLAAAAGIDRYADQARLAVAGVPGLVQVLAQRPDLATAVGCGGSDGLGGLAYGLARLHALLGEPALRDAAAGAAALAGAAATTAADAGWASGLAGCLAALTAVHADLGLEAAAVAAGTCADRLTERAGELAETLPAGFAAGLAGVGWSLATHGPAARHRHAGRRLAAHAAAADRACAAPGWCDGAAGLALARSCATGTLPASVAAGIASGPVSRDLSACHGELGITEVLGVLAAAAGPGGQAVRDVRRRAGIVLDVLRRHAAVCGTPGGVLTPGLLTGLSGIGYGLLRLAAPLEVPSVLLLQPGGGPRSAHHRIPNGSAGRTPSGPIGTSKENPPCRTP
jgi:type 2 lantibiotic biosynthesis protein LanM